MLISFLFFSGQLSEVSCQSTEVSCQTLTPD